MKTRYLVRVFEIENVKEYKDGGLDDIVEQTEDQIQPNRDFQFQLQGDSLHEIAAKLSHNPTPPTQKP